MMMQKKLKLLFLLNNIQHREDIHTNTVVIESEQHSKGDAYHDSQ